ALARGLIRQSHVIISDEGTAALDPKAGLAIENYWYRYPRPH
ncbi:ABC transporter ATPase and permease, partial [Lacticaseibacillus rhamnosus MTCC 5462]